MRATNLTIHIAVIVLAIGGTRTYAQTFTENQADRSATKPAPVEYLYPEQVTVSANKLTTLNLHFRVVPGMHINSHTPKDEFLIPTTFSIPDGTGAQLKSTTYPTGAELTLPMAPQTKLSVYTGEFVIQAHIKATAGDHLVEAKLRYQACDNKSCLPPKTILVAIDVVGK